MFGGPNLESQFWKANFGGPNFGPGPKLTSKDENLSIQLWIKVHNFLQFFNLLWCELVAQKRSDCCALDSKIIWHLFQILIRSLLSTQALKLSI